MDIYDAADVVQANIGEPIAIVQVPGEKYYYAIAYRPEVEHARGHQYAYSTHLVTNHYCEQGHYDMSRLEADEDLIYRLGYSHG